MKSQKKHDTKEVYKQADLLLRDPLFLFKAGKKVGDLGVVGEKRNRLVLILAAIGRTLREPPSILVKGPTSSGKSTLVNGCLQLFPPSCIVERAGLSKKALAHGKGSLAHKILFLNEYQCGRDAQQLMRLLQSEGRIAHEFTIIRGGKRETKTAKRTGMPVVVSTTTDEKVFADDETRFLSIWVDESPAQNRAIVLSRARHYKTPDTHDLPIWQKAMSRLTYQQGDFENPPKWIEFVAKRLPPDMTRIRRDWDRFLALSCAVALLRAYEKGRATKRVDIAFQDYCVAYRILEPVFASTLYSLKGHEYLLSQTVAKLNKHKKRGATVREIAEELSWKESLVYKHLKAASRKRLVRYESETRERNVKRVRAMGDGMRRFLPHPRLVLKHCPELGKRVEYIDPFKGKKKVIHK